MKIISLVADVLVVAAPERAEHAISEVVLAWRCFSAPWLRRRRRYLSRRRHFLWELAHVLPDSSSRST